MPLITLTSDIGQQDYLVGAIKGQLLQIDPAFKSIITQLYHQPFREEELKIRTHLLSDQFRNKENAERLINWIWG